LFTFGAYGAFIALRSLESCRAGRPYFASYALCAFLAFRTGGTCFTLDALRAGCASSARRSLRARWSGCPSRSFLSFGACDALGACGAMGTNGALRT
jgi:hypothetical protein